MSVFISAMRASLQATLLSANPRFYALDKASAFDFPSLIVKYHLG
jgi:hypothetical protein